MIYLDHHAATVLDARVAAAMHAASERGWANPSSVHAAGRASRALLEDARARIAAGVGVDANDLVLTSGGTEACNLGVLALLEGAPGGHVVTSAIEHPAVAMALAHAQATRGVQITQLAVPEGRAPSVDELRAALRPDTRLVALQWVNHETGSVLPVARYAELCRETAVPLFVDANQAIGKLPVQLAELGAAAVAFSAHKLGGPAGAGALFVRRGIDIAPRALGGGQERGRRAGTPDVIALVGFGAACDHALERLAAIPRIAQLRERLEQALLQLGAARNAPLGERVATVCNASFRNWRGAALVAALDLEGVAVSSGAACSSGRSEPSPVLLAMHGQEAWRADSALRFSFGVESTDSDVELALAALARVLARPPA